MTEGRGILLIYLCVGLIRFGIATSPTCSFEKLALTPARSEGSGWHSSGGLPIHSPIGIGDAAFDQLVELFRSHPDWGAADSMVIHGSRTHFGVGYGPSPSSDLDIMPFFPDPSKMQFGAMLKSLSPLRSHLGIENESNLSGGNITNLLPNGKGMLEALRDGDPLFQQHLSEQQERDLYQEMERLAIEQGWDRSRMTKETKRRLDEVNHKSFHRESIIVLRKTSEVTETVQLLREKGYQNIILID